MITIAIHTYEKAIALRSILENEGIEVELANVNLSDPILASGVRVRIPEQDLPLALRIIENPELFAQGNNNGASHSILVPVDLSEHAYKAAKVAAALARRQKTSLRFIYTYLDPYIAGNIQFSDTLTYDSGEKDAREQLGANARGLLKNYLDRLRADMKAGNVPVAKYSFDVLEGVPEDAIVDYARKLCPPLIVMGTRGAHRKDRDMIGSVTAEVLDAGRFTVLTVPEPTELQSSLHPGNILFLSNLDQNDILAMDTLYRLFGEEEPQVTIVHIPSKKRFSDNRADKALRKLSEYCCENFSRYHFETVPVNQADGDKEFLRLHAEKNFDLIVVPNRRRNAFSRLFNPGVAHRILFRSDTPMLVIPV